VRFDPAVITRQQLIDATVQALQSLDDPVYQGPVTTINASR
jgi:TPP-dependent trihydroxycyclohexane-1,2-dione (THcHDO) dehydratase